MVKVSVIVPGYNHARFLSERLDSIIAQTFRDFELIILDDASTDKSRELILDYLSRIPGLIIDFNEQNSGNPFQQWNRGVALAKGEFIWIAESDDFADIHFLEKTVSELCKSENIGLVYTDSWVKDEEKEIRYRFSQKEKYKVNANLTTQSFLSNPIPNVSSVLFRKNAYNRAGQADPRMKYCGDWMLYYNIHRHSKIVYLPEPLNTFRLHCDSQYHKYYKDNLFITEVAKVYRKILSSSIFSVKVMIIMLANLSKKLIVRLLYIINTPSYLLPEMPSRPREVEYLC